MTAVFVPILVAGLGQNSRNLNVPAVLTGVISCLFFLRLEPPSRGVFIPSRCLHRCPALVRRQREALLADAAAEIRVAVWTENVTLKGASNPSPPLPPTLG